MNKTNDDKPTDETGKTDDKLLRDELGDASQEDMSTAEY